MARGFIGYAADYLVLACEPAGMYCNQMVNLSSTPFKRTPAQKLFRFIAGIVIVGLIIWGLVAIPYDILREERARLYGEEVTSGLVLTVRTEDAGEYPGANLIIEYKYVDPDGYARRTEARLPDSLWKQYRPGTRLKVILVRGRPDMARIPDEVEPGFQVWLRELMN
ncbi:MULTISPECIES: hypothetical protein [unclassified Pseudodesulfovibrio]|uniref:hypothetical protein n=1 Tax=unclassified Pseudodesulfovibrio TaxID=2661612 RepID=UPI001F4FD737|nr:MULTISPECIES: hypothetical protein [unclassified Pseudodesulfovibrio]MCJ2165816.1 hypothetical protein [Pseudodesulfovibrio sp. S3-i]